MSWLDRIVPKSAPTQLPDLSTHTMQKTEKIGDAATLRAFRESVPLVSRAVRFRRGQVARQEWRILPIDQDAPFSEKVASDITNRLNCPDPADANNDFGSFIGSIVEDVVTLDQGVLFKDKDRGGNILALKALDGARLQIDTTWSGDPTKPRYYYVDRPGDTEGRPMLSDEVVTFCLNTTTYRRGGISPIAILYRTLEGYNETIARIQAVQRSGGPATMINVQGAGRENIRALRRRYSTEVEPTSSVMWTDFDVADLKTITLGSVDLRSQGTFDYYQILVNEIAAALDISAFDLMQANSAKYDTAGEQAQLSMDDGLEPLLAQIATGINRGVIHEWPGADNLQLIWPALLVDDEPEGAATIRARAGLNVNWMTINELRKADGLDPIDGADLAAQQYYDSPLVLNGTSTWEPVPVAAQKQGTAPGVPLPATKAIAGEVDQWYSAALKSFEDGEAIEPFPCQYINPTTAYALERSLLNVHSGDEIRELFQLALADATR